MNIKQPDYEKIYLAFPQSRERILFAQKEWDSLTSHLDQNGQLTSTRAKLVDRLVRDYVEYEFLYSEAMKDGGVKVSPDGGEYWSMKYSIMRKLKDDMLKLEQALGIPFNKSKENVAPKKKPTAADEFLKLC